MNKAKPASDSAMLMPQKKSWRFQAEMFASIWPSAVETFWSSVLSTSIHALMAPYCLIDVALRVRISRKPRGETGEENETGPEPLKSKGAEE